MSIVAYQHLLDNYKTLRKNVAEKNTEKGVGFNVFHFFNVNETKHSELIAHLLNPHANHGQGKLFLIAFLKHIGIEAPEKGHWVVTAEKGRIDVLLKRLDPHSVVVIENKSNYAGDQSHQLYRYWHQEIHYHNPNRDKINYSDKEGTKKYYQIIYLTPDESKQPSDNSMTRPEYLSSTLYEKLPLEPKVTVFQELMEGWLIPLLNDIPTENIKLRTYIQQYIELWS